MESLLRTKVSEFCVQDALRLSEIEERVQKAAGQTPSEQWNAEMFDFIYAVDSVFLQYKKAVICKEWKPDEKRHVCFLSERLGTAEGPYL